MAFIFLLVSREKLKGLDELDRGIPQCSIGHRFAPLSRKLRFKIGYR